MIAPGAEQGAPLSTACTTMPEVDAKLVRAPLIIVSGPSGSGKSTLIRRILGRNTRPLRLSVSATTRTPRPGEHEGVEYYFWTKEQFEKEIGAAGFLEYARVHDNYYGTLKKEVEPYLDRGIAVLLEIDVQGADQVRRHHPESVSVFVRAGSLAVIEKRLRERAADSEASIARRLTDASQELSRASEYDYLVENDNLDDAVTRLEQIVDLTLKGETHAG